MPALRRGVRRPGPAATGRRARAPTARRSARPLLIGVGAFVALGLAAAGGGLAIWFSRPRPAPPPQASNTSGEKPKEAAKDPAPGGAPAGPQFRAERRQSRKNLEEIALAFFHHAEVQGTYPRSEHADVRWTAAFVLEEFGHRAAEAVPVLAQALKDSGRDVRRRALFALRAAGAAARPAVPEVMKVLLEPDPGDRRWAGQDLSPVAADTLLRVADDPVPLFAEVMQSPRAKGRYAAAGALFQLGSASVPALMKLADAKDVSVRVQAVNCLGCLTAQAGKTVPLLVRLLRDDNRKVRREAVYALGSLGPRAKEAVGPLTRIAQDRQDPLQAAAARALERVALKDPGGR